MKNSLYNEKNKLLNALQQPWKKNGRSRNCNFNHDNPLHNLSIREPQNNRKKT